MQIFVLGMHRSGTSASARILNLMGAYFGGEDVSTGWNVENQRGFWERRDVRDVNDTILFQAGCDWDSVASFDSEAIPEERRIRHRLATEQILTNMDAHRPWFLKEPRLCVLFPIWREALETPVCVHVYRNPLEVAHSLKARNGIAIPVGLALWEIYNVRALQASAGLPRVFLSYNDLMEDPVRVVQSLHGSLVECGEYPLRLPTDRELFSFLDERLHRQRNAPEVLRATATSAQLRLYDLLRNATGSVAAPALSQECRSTLGAYEESVDIDTRFESAKLRRQGRSGPNYKLQLAVKEADLKHTLSSLRDIKESLRLAEREAARFRALEGELRVGLALAEEGGRTRDRRIADLERHNADATQALAEAKEGRRTRDRRIADLERHNADATQALAEAKEGRRTRDRRIADLERHNADATQALAEAKEGRRTRDRRIADLERHNANTTQALAEEASEARRLRLRRIRDYDAHVSRQKARVAETKELADELAKGLYALVSSRRWRLGNRLVSVVRPLQLAQKPRTMLDAAVERHRMQRRASEELANSCTRVSSDLSRQVADQTPTLSRIAQYDLARHEKILQMVFERRWELERRRCVVAALQEFIEDLIGILETLTKSRRWRLGNYVLSLHRLLVRRPLPLTVADSMLALAEQFRLSRSLEVQLSDKLDFNDPTSSSGPKVTAKVDGASTSGESEGLRLQAPEGRIRTDEALPYVPPPNTKVDVVVCVHNALDDVERCLSSVRARTTVAYQLIVVNDGSDEETCSWLSYFAEEHPDVELIETGEQLGYTRAANLGLRASSAPNVVLLNSDTIVPRLWLEGLLECMHSSSKIGIVGPLSNAATWQSIPKVQSEDGGWAVNVLPIGYSVDEFSELTYRVSGRQFPRVDFVNGFCLMISRETIDEIGYLDEIGFPKGYGEENDYCLRARAAGYELAIADHCFVYHAKSKSFGEVARTQLAKRGAEVLQRKYGAARIQEGTERLSRSSELAEARKAVDLALGSEIEAGRYGRFRLPERSDAQRGPRILYVLPVKGGSGGANSVMQEVGGMRAVGTHAIVATDVKYADAFRRFYAEFVGSGAVRFYDSDADLMTLAQDFDVIVATLWSTPALVSPIASRWPNKLYVYYIQDYEPWFFPHEPDHRKVAEDSYTLIPNMVLMAKTDWLCRTIRDRHGCEVHKVAPSLDHGVFFPGTKSDALRAVTIAAMIRPNTPRRAPIRTLEVLKEVVAKSSVETRVVTFGCETRDLQSYVGRHAPSVKLGFISRNYGVLTRQEVAELLRDTDIFVDSSDYQAFGRGGLEAMACGCAVVVPAHGGVYEYAQHNDNALVIDTTSVTETVDAITGLIEAPLVRRRMQARGIETASKYSILSASLSELAVFRATTLIGERERGRRALASRRPLPPRNVVTSGALVLVLLGVDGRVSTVGAVGMQRVLRPLRHFGVNERTTIRTALTITSLQENPSDVCVVCKGVVYDSKTAESIVGHCKRHDTCLVYEADSPPGVVGDSEATQADHVLATCARRVVVPSERLRSAYLEQNADVKVVVPALDDRIWLDETTDRMDELRRPDDGERLRALLLGGPRELEMMGGAWQQFMDDGEPNFLMDPSEFFLSRTKDDLPPIAADYIYDDFVRSLRAGNRWDIGVLPADADSHTADLIFLTYAALGLAIVCSSAGAHESLAVHGRNAMVVENTQSDWQRGLDELKRNDELRAQLRDRASYEFETRYGLNRWAWTYWHAYVGEQTRRGGQLR